MERGVDADKTFAVFFDERQDVFLLTVVEVHLARGAHKNQGVEVIEVLRVSVSQVFLGEEFGVGAQRDIPQRALVAHVVDRDHRIRNRIVLPSLRLTDDEQMFEMDFMSMRRRWHGRIHGRVLGEREGFQKKTRENEVESDSNGAHGMWAAFPGGSINPLGSDQRAIHL